MGYEVSFTITGKPESGIAAVQSLAKELDKLGALKGPEKLDATVQKMRGSVGDVANAVKALKLEVSALASHKGFSDLRSVMTETRSAALATSRAVRTMAQAFRTMSPVAMRANASATRAQNAALTQAAINAARITTHQQHAAGRPRPRRSI